MRRSNRQPLLLERINDSERPAARLDFEKYPTGNTGETGTEMPEKQKIKGESKIKPRL
jgi:hypothetical protein